MARKKGYIDNNPLWYKEAVVYQLHVKTFNDGNNDGTGDFKGLTNKLDYLKDLGVTAIWLLPFYPSPLRDDGYDIADYYNVHAKYGTLRDFKEFLRQAHSRGMRVITELVINHTSDQHPWFQRARKAAPDTKYRDYYVWSQNPDKYKDARIIFGDFENSNWAWDEEAKAYYWHRFYSHQPDLNFDNSDVQKELFRVMDYWFSIGVDGMRLDAVPYLFEREGTNCENLPQTYNFLRKLRKHVDEKFDNKMLLAEANQWPEDAVEYFGKGDLCHMAFHFPLMPRMYMCVQMEDRFPLIDILDQTPEIPPGCQWAIFLRNHDELTLEMVTDEERDYMYRSYAKDSESKINLGIRRRLVPLLGNNRRKIELMNILLLSLPGTPIIYYGDEIGMGDNRFLGDRDGVRTPMQWSPDRNAGFSKVNSQKLYLPVIIDSEYHYETVNVETQENNHSSLLWWMKRVIAMRKRYRSFSMGEMKFLMPENPKVLCFTRQYKDEIVLVIINLSRFSQYVRLDLGEYEGFTPKELFSQNDFPVIKEDPYTVMIGPHGHFWFLLEKPLKKKSRIKEEYLKLSNSWREILEEKALKRFESEILPEYLYRARWFRSKSLKIKAVKVTDILEMNSTSEISMLVIKVFFISAEPESYFLPLSFVFSKEDHKIAKDFPQSVICRVKIGESEGLIYDAMYNADMHLILLDLMLKRKKLRAGSSSITGYPGKMLRKIISKDSGTMESHILTGEQSNTSVIYDKKLYLKLFRKLEQGVNPDIEITKYLTEKRNTDIVPVFAGQIEYTAEGIEPVSLAIMQGCIQNPIEFWSYTLDSVKRYFEVYLSRIHKISESSDNAQDEKKDNSGSPEQIDPNDLIDEFYSDLIRLLGERTGRMHLELSSDKDDPLFKTEPFSMLYQRSLYQSMGSQARYVLGLLKKNLHHLDKGLRDEAEDILGHEKAIFARFKTVLKKKYPAKKIRIHGDYHLGQVVYTGKDFIIIDFEGEPARSISERKLKRSALRDIAGMMRSLHYAAYATLLLNRSVRGEDMPALEAAAELWYTHVSGIFLDSYYETVKGFDILPKNKDDLNTLLNIYLLDKAVYELGYEMNNRPDWLFVPIRGIRHIMEESMNANE